MRIETVSIIGLGALGILFGNHLAGQMPAENLRIIADRERIARYTREGIFCNGQPCHFHYVTPEEQGPPANLIIFAVKYGGLNEAISAVRHQVGKHTVLLSLLNGISSEESIAAAYGTERVLFCVAQGMDAVKVGNQMTYANMGMICFGDRQPGIISAQAQAVADFFTAMQLPHQLDTDMNRRMWGKLMLNVGVNQAVALLGSAYGDVQREGPAREVMVAAMREVIALSQKENVNLTENDLQYWLQVVSTLSPLGKPSMRQDIEAGRASELELFAGTIIRLGEKHHLPTPVNQMLYDGIRSLENGFQPSAPDKESPSGSSASTDK
ncbi:MAG TPA: ketopantoate reductase family protein [Syntrophomonas sp.]|nr:ketopantoate reductase family protein [Syntrophomonas sp.]HRW12640.1 ketopantoate reductase family protein [Syntrophomonas sp.]